MAAPVIKNSSGPVRTGGKKQGTKILKGGSVSDGESIRIVSEKGQVLKKSTAEVVPIIENDMIVGVIHHCTCGKKTEIRFEFEE